MANPKFSIRRSRDDQHYFTLTAANGEVILTSELYTTRSRAESGTVAVQEHAPFESHYERLPSDGQFYFRLRAGNGELIGTSERYTSPSARDAGIDAVRQSARVAIIED
jgi:uncharacterized protein YegP (UPF0339 family)